MIDLNCSKKLVNSYFAEGGNTHKSLLKKRLRHWQHSRSWARLICEAEKMWRLDSKELKRLGAIELTQIHNEMPVNVRKRVNYWLIRYSGSTRLEN